MKTKNMTTLFLSNSISRSPLRRWLPLIAVALACFALSSAPKAFGVTPAPDGFYANGNTAEGQNALFSLSTGASNTALGINALYHTTTGAHNTAEGAAALASNTTGALNTASGVNALFKNTMGIRNTADGVGALFNNTTGNLNIALGYNAGFNLTTGSNNIDIGNVGVAGESGKIRIGVEGTQTVTFIAGIYNTVPLPNGVPVAVDNHGQLGVALSSQRFKEQIKAMDKASESILGLRPVTFRYKLDPDGTPQFGLVAEDVEKVNPNLVVRDAKGQVFTVRYEAVNAMLLNEFLKEHRKVEEQETTMMQLKATVAKQEVTATQQQKEIKALTATLKEQASQIQKVSAQLELNKPASQMVLNNQ
jgi:uncharacterized coiled-coil protein SlyX